MNLRGDTDALPCSRSLRRAQGREGGQTTLRGAQNCPAVIWVNLDSGASQVSRGLDS